MLYILGQGVKPNPSTAVSLLQKGVRAGDGFCLFLYAGCYETGTGVKPDAALARDYYKKSAATGNADAQKWCKDRKIDFPRPQAKAPGL